MQGARAELLLAPAVPGDIILLNVDGSHSWAIQKASFMACDEHVTIGTKIQGFSKACCSDEGLFVLKATGKGRLLVTSYGGVIRYDLKAGEVRLLEQPNELSAVHHREHVAQQQGRGRGPCAALRCRGLALGTGAPVARKQSAACLLGP